MIIKISPGDYKGARVIIGSPSVGNVGQLATDLLISTLKIQRVGMVWHETILPIIGYDPYDETSSNLCTANDFYYSADHKLMLIQFRSSLHGSRKSQNGYLEKLVDYLKEQNVESVTILAGIFNHGRSDSEILSSSFRYISNAQFDNLYKEKFQSLAWTRMKGSEPNAELCPKLSGAGFSRRLFNISTEKSLPCNILLYFCSEGDNIADAVKFTQSANQLFGILPHNNFVYPPSWKYLFGNSVPIEMY